MDGVGFPLVLNGMDLCLVCATRKKEGRATHRMRLAKSGGTNHSIERAGGFLLAQARFDLSRSLALH